MKPIKLIKLIEQVKKHNESSSIQQLHLVKLADECIEEYSKLDIKDEKKDLYDFLYKKGNTLTANLQKLSSKKKQIEIKKYLRLVRAAVYDFKDESYRLSTIGKWFITMCVLFFALSPQFLGFLLPLIMVLPIFMGLRGLKNRTRVGFYLAISVIPMALLVSTNWLKYFLYSLQDVNASINNIVESANVSYRIAQLLVFLPSIGGIVLLVAVVMMSFLSYKHHKLFI